MILVTYLFDSKEQANAAHSGLANNIAVGGVLMSSIEIREEFLHSREVMRQTGEAIGLSFHRASTTVAEPLL